MAVSNREVMDMLKSEQGTDMAPTPTPPPSEQGAMTPPMPSPMSTPEPQAGQQEQARLNIMMALDMLQNALQPWYGKRRGSGTSRCSVKDHCQVW